MHKTTSEEGVFQGSRWQGIVGATVELLPTLLNNEEILCPSWIIIKGVGPGVVMSKLIIPADMTITYTFPSFLIVPPVVGLAILSMETVDLGKLVSIVSRTMQDWDRASEIKAYTHLHYVLYWLFAPSKKGISSANVMYDSFVEGQH